MTGIFNPPLVNVRDAFEPGQRARAAAVLVAAQARPTGSLSELVGLARFVCSGDTPEPETSRRNPYELFGTEPRDTGMITTDPGPVAMNEEADPSAFAMYRHPGQVTVPPFGPDPVERAERIPNFGDLDNEDDGLG